MTKSPTMRTKCLTMRTKSLTMRTKSLTMRTKSLTMRTKSRIIRTINIIIIVLSMTATLDIRVTMANQPIKCLMTNTKAWQKSTPYWVAWS